MARLGYIPRRRMKMWAGRVLVPASSSAGTGGSVRVGRSVHGLDLVTGGVANIRNKSNTSSITASVINATTIRFLLPGYTAATCYFDVIIWGTAA